MHLTFHINGQILLISEYQIINIIVLGHWSSNHESISNHSRFSRIAENNATL